MDVDVRRADDRFVTRTDWLDSRHSFSFGDHYSAADTGFALLVVNNDDVLAPGGGFDTHAHRDMEIVTWVLEGSLAHRDSTGRSGLIRPRLAQRMSAGTGISHSERNDTAEPVRFVQMWVLPDEASVEPGYEQQQIDPARLAGGWVTVASGIARDAGDTGETRGTGGTAVRIHQRSAALHAARLLPGEHVDLPVAPYVHLYVPVGAVELRGAGRLDAGDAARVRFADAQRLTATAPAEVLAWEMHTAVAA